MIFRDEAPSSQPEITLANAAFHTVRGLEHILFTAGTSPTTHPEHWTTLAYVFAWAVLVMVGQRRHRSQSYGFAFSSDWEA